MHGFINYPFSSDISDIRVCYFWVWMGLVYTEPFSDIDWQPVDF